MYTLVIMDEFNIRMIDRKQRWSIAPCSLETAKNVVRNALKIKAELHDSFAFEPLEKLLEYNLENENTWTPVYVPNTRLLIACPVCTWQEMWSTKRAYESDVRFWYCVRN